MPQPEKVMQKKIIIQVKVALIKSRSETKKKKKKEKKKRKRKEKSREKKSLAICGTFVSGIFLRTTFSGFKVVLNAYLRLNASHIETIQINDLEFFLNYCHKELRSGIAV